MCCRQALLLGLLGTSLLWLLPADAQAQFNCRRGAGRGYVYSAGVIYGYPTPAGVRYSYLPPSAGTTTAGERYFYVPPTGAAPAGASQAAAPERYFYMPVSASGTSAAPPRVWQPGDADPGNTHTNE